MEATCSWCETVKPITDFYQRKDRPQGYTSWCIACTKQKDKERRDKKVNSGIRRWDERRDYFRKYQESGRRSAVVNGLYRKMKDMVIAGYGGKCTSCGFSDKRALHLDHVNGGGRAERKSVPHATILRRIIKEKYPDGYQLLCANCNTIKMYENKEFPGWRSHERSA